MDAQKNTVQSGNETVPPSVVDSTLATMKAEETKAPAKKKLPAVTLSPQEHNHRFDVSFHRQINEAVVLSDEEAMQIAWDGIFERGVNANRATPNNLRPRMRERLVSLQECPYLEKVLAFRNAIGWSTSTVEIGTEIYRRMDVARTRDEWMRLANYVIGAAAFLMLNSGFDHMLSPMQLDTYFTDCPFDDVKREIRDRIGDEWVSKAIAAARANGCDNFAEVSSKKVEQNDGGRTRAQVEARRAANRATRHASQPAPGKNGGSDGGGKGEKKSKKNGKGKH